MRPTLIIIAAIFNLLSIYSCQKEGVVATSETERLQTSADNPDPLIPSLEEMREQADNFSQTIIPVDKIRELENLLIESDVDTSQFSTRQIANLITQSVISSPNTDKIKEFENLLSIFSKKDFYRKGNGCKKCTDDGAPREKGQGYQSWYWVSYPCCFIVQYSYYYYYCANGACRFHWGVYW